MSNDNDDVAAADRFTAERDSTISPAQPDDAHRIDETNDSDAAPGPAHVKHERPAKMEN
jgi:hypothetical protein